MSQSFNFVRFGRLFRKHTAEHLRGYLLATAVPLGGIGLVLGYVAYLNTQAMSVSVQAIVFILGLLSSGAFFTSTVLAPFGPLRQATSALLLPASHWEKYLVAWLYALPIFMVVYTGCFYLMDALVLQLDDWAGPKPDLVPLFTGPEKLYTGLMAYAVLNAVFLWGSIYFTKQQFIRTAFGVLLGLVVLVLVNFQVVQALVGRKVESVLPFSGLVLREGKAIESLDLPPGQGAWLVLVPVGLMLLGWAGAYARLTEKQI